MKVDFGGRVVIVTGAVKVAEGIAKVFAQSGAKWLSQRAQRNVASTTLSIRAEGHMIQCDVGHRAEVERMVAVAAEQWPLLASTTQLSFPLMV